MKTSQMYVRVWDQHSKAWALFGQVENVIRFDRSEFYKSIMSTSLASPETREPVVEFKFWHNDITCGFSMKNLVRDLCMPTYEHPFWDKMPYWLFCPLTASNGLERILTKSEEVICSGKKHAVVPSANETRHFPDTPTEDMTNYEKLVLLKDFSKQDPIDPYFTLEELESRGELECRVFDFDHKSIWKSATIMMIFNSYLVGFLTKLTCLKIDQHPKSS